MKTTTRRSFLKTSVKTSLTAGLALSCPRLVLGADRPANAAGPHDAVRLAVVGLGATEAIGGVGGRGHQLIARLRQIPDAKIVALCDVDTVHIDREAKPFKDRGEAVKTYTDLRRVLDDKDIDAVVVATPNHWHVLATVWACQAGKDVYVEKPFSHDIWEGRQGTAAARKYGRMVQVGMQNRSSPLLHRLFEDLRAGSEIGPIRFAHAIVYRARDPIGSVSGPMPISPTVDYNLWCGPAPDAPLMRRQLHYEWHWFWSTGNGEIGNNGVHMLDLCRWALNQNELPHRAVSIGGRFAFDDCAQTANTQIALLDYDPAPIICEVRNIREAKGPNPMGTYRGRTGGLVISCEGGYFAGDASGGGLFDKQGKKIKDIDDNGSSKNLETLHLSNFLSAVRSRKADSLAAEVREGHLSAALCHMPNVSYRLGKEHSPEEIRDAIKSRPELSDAFDRCDEYLRQNGVNLGETPATLGPWVTYDNSKERFVQDFAEQANKLSRRDYREAFVVPELA